MKNTEKHHLIIAAIVIVFVVLAAGEVSLYRNEMQIKAMVSEGLMQVKEEMRAQRMMLPPKNVMPLPSPTMHR